jgi:hypothetical protein
MLAEGDKMKKTKFFCMIICCCFLLTFFSTACENQQASLDADFSSEISEKGSLKTIYDAVEHYINSEETQNYMKSDYFTYAYRIKYVENEKDATSVWFIVECKWYNTQREMMSGGGNLVNLNLEKGEGKFVIKDFQTYSEPPPLEVYGFSSELLEILKTSGGYTDAEIEANLDIYLR